MAKIRFQTECPGCGDKHFAVECKRPNRFSPTIAKVFCDHCESVSMFRILLPKDRSDRTQIEIKFIQIVPSPMLLALWKELRAKDEAANKEKETAKEAVEEPDNSTLGIPVPITESDATTLLP